MIRRLYENALKNYPPEDIVTRMKARIFLGVCLVVLLIIEPITLVFYSLVHMHDPTYQGVYSLVFLAPVVIAVIVCAVAITLMLRGRFALSAHFVLTVALAAAWTAIILDRTSLFTRMDTIAFVLALLTMAPLVVSRRGIAILIYGSLNLIALIAFLLLFRNELEVQSYLLVEFFGDNAIAIAIICLTGYAVFTINQRALNRAARDLKERMRVEEDLKQSVANYRQVVSSIPIVIWKTDVTAEMTLENTYISPAADALLGLPSGTVGTSWDRYYQHIHPDDLPQRYHALEEILRHIGRKVTHEYRIIRADGEIRWVTATGMAVRNEHGEVQLFGTNEDITERIHAQEERTKLEDQLRQAQKMESIGRLAGGVAHDFNNLLTVIQGNTDLILLKLPSDDPQRKRLQVVIDAVHSASNLTRQLLAFSRQQIIQPKVIDLQELIAHLHKMLVRLIGEDIELQTLARSDVGLVYADPGQIEQIILNLAVNARDAMPDGGKLTIETARTILDQAYHASHPYAVPGDYVMLAVSDTGSGMDTEVKQHLFEPFFTTKGPGKGTGLGLATVYGAVKQNRGTIEVYSEPSQGTTFKIYFPQVAGTAEDLVRRPETQQLPQGCENILLVEDDGLVRTFTQQLLEMLGYRVHAHATAEEALEALPDMRDAVDLLLSDVVLPGMNGKTLAEKVGACVQGVKVLYTSGYTESVIVTHGILEEGLHFIGKPYTAQSLAAKVRHVLDGG